MTHVVLLAPRPAEGGGVSHHTQRLAASWRASGSRVTVDDAPPRPRLQLAAWRRAGVTALLVQYVPFLYGRFGLSPSLVRLVRDARAAGIRVTVFAHEAWVPPTRLPWVVLSPLQRRQLLVLARLADKIVTAVPAWRDQFGDRAELLYVGSNLGKAPTDFSPTDSPVLFSPFASGLKWDWVTAAVEAIGANPGLVVVGADDQEARAHPATARAFSPTWDCRGHLPAKDVLRVVGGAPVALAPFVDGPTGRRGSLLALLSTGVRVLCADGHLTDPFFVRGPVEVATSRDDFVARALAAYRDPAANERDRPGRRAWYEEHLDPHELDARLLAIVTGATL